jgi:Bacterial Ig domain
VTRFDQASSKPSGSAANGVIGQPDFTTDTLNTTAQGLNRLRGSPFVDAAGSLWVPDTFNYRILRFPSGPDVEPQLPPVANDTTAPTLSVLSKFSKSTKKGSIVVKGSASDVSGVKSVQFKVGKGPLQTATGTTSWQSKAKLKKGENMITFNATDNAGNVSTNQVIKIKRK